MKDLKFVLFLTVLYGVIAFINLGNTQSPESLHRFGDVTAIADLGAETYISRFQYFVGLLPDESFLLLVSRDGVNWETSLETKTEGVFSWKECEIGKIARYVAITPLSGGLSMFEIGFRGENNELLPIVYAPDTLIDEQNLVPLMSAYENSTYFDEIYHARTAYEILNGESIYEYTHPPLGKVIISAGISIFGMNPFGWRFMGTVCGILMVPLMYAFAKKIFKCSECALFAAFIFTFDFMHFAQTRISTIDSYTVLFVMAMYYFMYVYWEMDSERYTLPQTLVPLFFSGLFMGLAIAVKWQGVYAAVGLAVLFFTALFFRHKNQALPTIAWCFLFFLFIPVGIYFLSYIPYFNTPGYKDFGDIIKNQLDMFSYHANLTQGHPYGSPWWQWPLNLRPIFYYSADYGGGIKAGISSFGNPAVWLLSLPAFVGGVYMWAVKKQRNASFLVIALLAQILPWVPISRTTFIYHYFPSVPFIVLLITLMFREVIAPKHKMLPKAYCGLVFILFIMFYPVLSGMPVYQWYVDYFLKWLPTWQLIL